MDYASDVLSSTERAFSLSNSKEPCSSSDRKSGLWLARSAKCLFLGGLAASYGWGSMESSAGKTADMARFGDFSLADVGLEPARGAPRFQDYSPLLSDAKTDGLMSPCMRGIIAGGVGALFVQNTLPLVIGLGGCLSGVSAQQRIGNEFQVNTYTTLSQGVWSPSVARFSNGNFVVTWQSDDQDGSTWGVYGQLFDGNANRIGNEFLVNTHTDNWQNSPSAASFSNGNFVVTWNSGSQDGSRCGIYCQLFDGNATRVGNEFQVNSYIADDQCYPSVASFSNDNFVVTWQSWLQDGSYHGIYGQLFDGDATKLGNEFQVNTYTTSEQKFPSVAAFSNNNFVVTWHSNYQDGDSFGVYGQLFDENTTRIGNEFQVNTYTINNQRNPSVASFINGSFVVTWESSGQDSSSNGVYGQLFDVNGARIGNEFQVNTYTDSFQSKPSVSSFSNGNFIVTWESPQDGDAYGVYGQLFDGNAVRIGNEFQVNTYTDYSQEGPSVASFGNYNFIVTWARTLWSSHGQYDGIYGQLFEGHIIETTLGTSNDNTLTSSGSSTTSSFSSFSMTGGEKSSATRMSSSLVWLISKLLLRQ